MLRLPVDFERLPDVQLYELCLWLTPEETTILARTCARFKQIARSAIIWKKHYQRNFIYRDYSILLLQTGTDWYAQFRESYQYEYKGLSSSERHLWSKVKNGTYKSLKEEITLRDFTKLNAHGVDLISTIATKMQKKQALFNEIYELAKESYYDEAKQQVDVFKKTDDTYTILYWALVCHRSRDDIACLIAAGSRWDECYSRMKVSALHVAALGGSVEGAETLIQNCEPENRLALINKTDFYGQTPLLYATHKPGASFPMVEFILKQGNGVQVNTVSQRKHGGTALYGAVRNGDLESVAALFKAGANSTTYFTTGSYPIHLAAQCGHLPVVKFLLEKQSDLLNQKDGRNQTPLMFAASGNHLPMVKFLLEQNGLDLNATSSGFDNPQKDYNNRTALHWAAEKGHAQVAKALIAAGVDPTVASGETDLQALHLAAREGHLEVVKVFLKELKEKPDLLNQKDRCNQTPLMWAASRNHLPVVRFLVEQKNVDLDATSSGFDNPQKDYNNRTALHWAAEKGHAQVAEALMDAGALTTVPSGEMRLQPLHLAAREGHLEVVKVLLKEQKEKPDLLNQVDAGGQTPLMWAAARGHLSVVQFLLKKPGIDVNARSQGFRRSGWRNGQTALAWAAREGHTEIVEALLDHTRSRHLDVDAPLYKSKTLAKRVVAKFKLLEYLAKIKSQAHDKKSFTFWGHSFSYGISREDKLRAAKALKAVAYGDAKPETLAPHARALNNGDLGSISRCLAFDERASITMRLQPIHRAARDGCLDAIKALLKDHPDLLNQVDAGGQTPLMWAAARGHLSVVQFLLKRPGIDVNARSQGFQRSLWRNGQTALAWAARAGHTEIVEALLLDHTLSHLNTPLFKSKKLDKQVAAKLELLEYIPQRASQARYKIPRIFWYCPFNYGICREDKLKAAKALKAVVYGGADPATLNDHAPALNNGDLGSIYRRLQVHTT